MKKIVMMLMLAQSITGQSFAQNPSHSNSDKTFELPENSMRRKFSVNLDKGNTMQIELTNIQDMQFLRNVDSLLDVFLKDMEPLKDSLTGDLISHRVDYILDSGNTRKIRIQKFAPKGSHFAVTNGEAALLKLEQDTITMTGKIGSTSTQMFFRKVKTVNYYRVSFFVNKLSDLAGYMDGRLNEAIRKLEQDVNTNWASNKDGTVHLKKNPAVSAPAARGYVGGSDFLTLRFSVDAQNYKSYFVPSASLGVAVVFINNFVVREFGVGSENHFLFSKNDSGKLLTNRNTFLTLSYGKASIKNNESKINASLYPFISVGYLLKSRGGYYDKNTFKVGVGRFSFFGGTTKIEPTFYFNNFFKGLTPSFRIIQSF